MRKSWLNMVPGFVFVALAAAMWATDGILRVPLAGEIPASMIVFLEHAILVLVTIPLLRGVGPTLRTLDRGDWISLLLIGAGASAVATALFTQSFTYGEFTTTLLLQKLQPIVVLVGAWWILGERPLARYWSFFAVAVGGAWFITFSEPWFWPWEVWTDSARQNEAAPALLAIGAAALWGMGTVLGRRLTPKLEFKQLTAMRFLIGLPAAAVVVSLTSAWGSLDSIGGADFLTLNQTLPSGLVVPGGLLLVAAVPGLIAMLSYYRGLRTTPALSATLAELTFPLAAIVLNAIFLEVVPNTSQWIGVLILSNTITAIGFVSARANAAAATGVRIESPARIPEPV